MKRDPVQSTQPAGLEAASQPLAEAQGADRRKDERSDCDGFAEVVIDGGGLMFRGRIRDLSTGGCYIETRVRLYIKTGVAAELSFTVDNLPLKALARVRMIRPGAGVGFEFIHSASQSHAPAELLALIQKLNSAIAPVALTPGGR